MNETLTRSGYNARAIFEAMGFGEAQTGGGCTALSMGYDDDKGEYVLITSGDTCAPTEDDETFSIGIYDAESRDGTALHYADEVDLKTAFAFLQKHAQPFIEDGLAEVFAQTLEQWLSPAEFERMKERNKTDPDPLVCHSHDFCDANMAMLAAFELFGLEMDAENPDHAKRWNEAWEIARKDGRI